ncbi:MAG: hypothetical protein K8S56_06660, partial [Candidatus Cloacimonetes bacterium]|nr:hypothetical protein [Candidatus Cloacimonadota bacterium]
EVEQETTRTPLIKELNPENEESEPNEENYQQPEFEESGEDASAVSEEIEAQIKLPLTITVGEFLNLAQRHLDSRKQLGNLTLRDLWKVFSNHEKD